MSAKAAATTTNPEAPNIIKLEEIKKHTSRDDLWMVINGKVYDVTPFVDEHPISGVLSGSSESSSSSLLLLIIAAVVAAAAFFYLQTKK
ncbi:hypothetical protein D0Z03_001922 [Geotrichum reessii]|nr:hypothetical protein D0Z03_001922 [Galactomyces reessii]